MGAYWIVISSAGSAVGEIENANAWENTDPLDQAGSFRFTMPAATPKASLLQTKRVATCYTLLNGAVHEVGNGVIDQIRLQADGEGNPTGLLEVSGSNRLQELTYRTLGGLIIDNGSGGPTTGGPATLIGYAPSGWTLDVTHGYNASAKAITHTFESETVLAGFVKLVELTGEHFRAGSGSSLIWMKNDRPDSGVRAFFGGVSEAIDRNAVACLITSIEELADGNESHIGRVYADGSGNGSAKYTLQGSSVPGGYTGYVLGNDAKGYYLEHTATWATYGIERVKQFKDISSAQTLLEASYEYLKNALSDNISYRLSLAGLKTTLTPGSTIRVVAQQWVGSFHAIDVDGDLVILDVTNRIDENGLRTTELTCSTSDKRLDSDINALVAQLGQAANSYSHVQKISGSDVVGTVPASHSGTPVVDRVVSFADVAGTLKNSNISDAVSGAVATLLGALTGDRSYTLQDAPGTIALLEQIQTWAAEQTIVAFVAQKIYPGTDSATALQMLKADKVTVVVNVDTNARTVGIGTTNAGQRLNIQGHLNFVTVAKPTVAPTAVVSGAGGVPVSSDTRYKFTYVTATGETNFPVNYASVVISTPSQVTVGVTASADPSVTGIRLYRTSVAYGSVNAYFFHSLLANATANVNDTKTDAQLGTDRSEARDNSTAGGMYVDGTTRIFYAVNNVFIGSQVAPAFTVATQATGVGALALNALTSGAYLAAFGTGALQKVNVGSIMAAFGPGAGSSNVNGSTNLYAGPFAGLLHTGSYCIFLGPYAGAQLTSVNYRFIVDYSNTLTPFIDGDMLAKTIIIRASQTLEKTDAATVTVTDVEILDHESSGTTGAGFGTGLLFNGTASTTAAQNMARVLAVWNDAANKHADIVFQPSTSGTPTEKWRMKNSGRLDGPKSGVTEEGGYYTTVTAGENLSRGNVVYIQQAGGTDDRVFKTTTSNEMPVGIVYADATTGNPVKIVVSGIAYVLPESGVTATRGYVIYTSASETGVVAQSATVPSTVDHWRECGHFLDTGSGNGALTRAIIHWN